MDLDPVLLSRFQFAWLIGWLARDGNWQSVFYISAVAMAMNSVCWFFFDASRKIWPEAD